MSSSNSLVHGSTVARLSKVLASVLVLLAFVLVIYRAWMLVKKIMHLDVNVKQKEHKIDTSNGLIRGVLAYIKEAPKSNKGDKRGGPWDEDDEA